MIRRLLTLAAALLIAAWPPLALAQVGPGPPPSSGGGGSGTVTSVVCPSGTITTSGPCNPLGAAGTNGDVVTANGANGIQDSGTPLSALSFIPLPPRQSGNWYMPYFNAAMTTGAALTANRMIFMPFSVLTPTTTSHLGARINTLSSGGNIQLAIYPSSNTCTGATTITYCPTGTAICSTASMSTTTAGLVSATASCTLTAGTLYWMGVTSDNSVATCQTINANASIATYLVGSATQATLSSAAGTSSVALFASFGTFGNPWPTVTSTSWTESNTNQTCMIELQAA